MGIYTTIQVSPETRDLLNSLRDKYGHDNVVSLVLAALEKSNL